MVAMLVLSPIVVIPFQLTGSLRGVWEVDGANLGAAILIAFATAALERRSRRLGPGVTWGAFAHGFLGYGVVRAVYGAIFLVTGFEKTGYRSFSRGRRADSIYDLLLAASLCVVSAAFAAADRPARERRRARRAGTGGAIS